jgi:hypothetical protein
MRNLETRIWLRDALPGRELFDATEYAALDCVDARRALESPNHPGVFCYCEVTPTGRKWRFDAGTGTWRYTVRVRFVGPDDTDTAHAAEIIAARPADFARHLSTL